MTILRFFFICPSFRRTYYAVRCSGNFFVGSSSKFFYICFGPLGVRICNKKFWCLSFCHSVILSFCEHATGYSFGPICMKFGSNVYLGGLSEWYQKIFEIPIFTPPGGTLVFFRHTKISKFPQFWSNLHEIWHKSVSMGY